MNTSIISVTDSDLKQVKKLLEILSNSTSAYIFVEILRHPEITAHELKKRLKIKGSKIYFHLNRLKDTRIIEETGNIEQLPNQLSRNKFSITKWLESQIKEGILCSTTRKHLRYIYLFHLHLSNAIIQNQIKNLDSLTDGEFLQYTKTTLEMAPDNLLMFVDSEAASILKENINSGLNFCRSKYAKMDLIESLKKCEYGALTGIYHI
ncbi:MAG: hypothetical protein HeimC3_52190 [Candidatus Heimdallarchaeota archaeon LC_3]|nr:MAG: hypothetical protein HeimC3_52190 [Candidatus Heimdallarchaeota archaeon LC_3]